MKITEVKIFTLNKEGNLKAFVSVTFDKVFVVGGMAVVSGSNGLFVKMPSRKQTNGEYKDTCFPITKEFREELNEAVLNKYKSEIAGSYEEKKEVKGATGKYCSECGDSIDKCICNELPF